MSDTSNTDPAPAASPEIPPSPEAEADVKETLKDANQDDSEETVEKRPPAVHETVEPRQLDVEHPTVNREVHEDAYHTTVQTVKEQQVAPEQVTHTIAPVQETVTDERDDQAVQDRLAQEASQFKDTREVHETVHTAARAPVVVGEHHHYHVHERVQPIIERQIIQPTVVHTTVPVHETIHKSAHFSTPTSLAAVSLADFQASGGQLQGSEPEHTSYSGKPHRGDVFDN